MSANGLEIITTTEHEVTIGGEKIIVTPIRMGKLQAFTKALEPIFGEVTAAISGNADMLHVIAHQTSEMIDAVSIGSGLSRERIEELLPDEFLDLASAVLMANADFFARRLLPRVSITLAQIKQQVEALGPTASKP